MNQGVGSRQRRPGSAERKIDHDRPLACRGLGEGEALLEAHRGVDVPLGEGTAAVLDTVALGDGAGVLVLEEYEQARKRGAPILAEVLGFGMSSDAYHISAPSEDGDGAVRCMRAALDDAGLNPEDVDYVNAHGTGTEANDRIESKAISKLMGSASVPVYSVKSQIGHCLGAAGIIEATAGLLSMQSGIIPATVNFSMASSTS